MRRFEGANLLGDWCTTNIPTLDDLKNYIQDCLDKKYHDAPSCDRPTITSIQLVHDTQLGYKYPFLVYCNEWELPVGSISAPFFECLYGFGDRIPDEVKFYQHIHAGKYKDALFQTDHGKMLNGYIHSRDCSSTTSTEMMRLIKSVFEYLDDDDVIRLIKTSGTEWI